MTKNKALIGLILLVIGFTSSKISFSQDTIEDQIVLKDFSSLILPPIDSLFLSLENNPNIKAQDYRILEQESVIKSQKREWINYLRFSSSYQYGYQGAESLVQGFLIPAYYQTSENAQNLYHVGVSLTIPFGDVIDRGNKVKKEKIRLGQIQAEKEISINDGISMPFSIDKLYCHYEPVGCVQCHGTGYTGRSAVYEFMENSVAVSKAIYEQKSAEELERLSSMEGTTTLWTGAAEKVKSGITSLAEARRILQE